MRTSIKSHELPLNNISNKENTYTEFDLLDVKKLYLKMKSLLKCIWNQGRFRENKTSLTFLNKCGEKLNYKTKLSMIYNRSLENFRNVSQIGKLKKELKTWLLDENPFQL